GRNAWASVSCGALSSRTMIVISTAMTPSLNASRREVFIARNVSRARFGGALSLLRLGITEPGVPGFDGLVDKTDRFVEVGRRGALAAQSVDPHRCQPKQTSHRSGRGLRLLGLQHRAQPISQVQQSLTLCRGHRNLARGTSFPLLV